ncbi:hypothetical protein N7G274_000898 [Stereocaulon virgatum]|uniref:Uncharacterized protein n=1 Tax=Stereocaulon virgatum TaxID=373712 RepID=A0ABR4AMC1_9LECA
MDAVSVGKRLSRNSQFLSLRFLLMRNCNEAHTTQQRTECHTNNHVRNNALIFTTSVSASVYRPRFLQQSHADRSRSNVADVTTKRHDVVNVLGLALAEIGFYSSPL